MARSPVADRGGEIQVCIVSANILNKQSRRGGGCLSQPIAKLATVEINLMQILFRMVETIYRRFRIP
jgi:hypothetical protein